MKLKTLKGLIRRLLREATCPGCGNADAYIGMNNVECPKRSCRFYSKEQDIAMPQTRVIFKQFSETDMRKFFPEAYTEFINNCYPPGIFYISKYPNTPDDLDTARLLGSSLDSHGVPDPWPDTIDADDLANFNKRSTSPREGFMYEWDRVSRQWNELTP